MTEATQELMFQIFIWQEVISVLIALTCLLLSIRAKDGDLIEVSGGCVVIMAVLGWAIGAVIILVILVMFGIFCIAEKYRN